MLRIGKISKDDSSNGESDTDMSISKQAVLEYIERSEHPVKNADIVGDLYPTASSIEKTKLVKNLSVVLYFLEKDGKIEKVKDTSKKKGHYYMRKGMQITKL